MSKIMSRKDDYLPGGIIQTTKPHTSWPWVNRGINCLIQNQTLEQKKSQLKTAVKLVMMFGLAGSILLRLNKYHCLLSAK